MDDLHNRRANLALSDEDTVFDLSMEQIVFVSATPPIQHWFLVSRFLIDRPIKLQIVENVLAAVWRPLMGVRVSKFQPNLFLFQFLLEDDMQRVIDDGYWFIDNQMLLCKRIAADKCPFVYSRFLGASS